MTPIKLLQLIEKELRKYQQQYAIAGGLAASYYRKQPRLTNDLDIAINTGSIENSKKSAIKIIENIGYNSAFGWIASAEKKLKNPVALVIGSKSKDSFDATIDFLLPVFPWVEKAIVRAQNNLIDYGFSTIPTMTIEDIIIAKTFALNIEAKRFQDLDDLQSIFLAKNELDLSYLVAEFERLKIAVPTSIRANSPKSLSRIATG